MNKIRFSVIKDLLLPFEAVFPPLRLGYERGEGEYIWEVFLEAMDKDLLRHSKRVGMYANVFGEICELPDEILRYFKLAALTHDIGKISNNLNSILKRQINTPPEQFKDAREKHVIVGNTLLQILGPKLPGLCFTVLQQHHEDWNGGGYPRGLSGDQIDISAQIFRYCDAFDSATPPKRANNEQCAETFSHSKHIMIDDQRYLRGLSPNAAVQQITEQIGRRFSPKLRQPFNKFIDWYFDTD